MKICLLLVFVIFPQVIISAKKGKSENQLEVKKSVCIVKGKEEQMTTFDFTKISNQDMSDYVMKNHENKSLIDFQLCSPLKKQCNGQDDYSICLKNEDKEIGLGKYPPQVVFENFQIAFKFTGDRCNETSNYTTIVIMQCDYNATGNNSYPQVYPYDKNQCDIYLHWMTSEACGPEHKIDCSVTDNTGYKYDLSKLMKLSNNYRVHVNNNSEIILNVCRPVIFGHGVSCHQKTASCLINISKLNESGVDSGQLNSPLIIEKEGLLKIEYSGGDICHTGQLPHIKTVIAFICDPTEQDSYPKYVNGSEACNYYFEWRTPLACKGPVQNKTLTTLFQELVVIPTIAVKKESVIRSTENYQVNCSVTTKNGVIDLTPLLLTKDDYMVKANDSEFHINVCTSLVSTENLNACRGSSVCKIQHDKNGATATEIILGNPGQYLIVHEDRNVVLQYKGGATCPENKTNSISTNVTFICNYLANRGSPQFDKYEDCTYSFKWKTKFVCDSVIGNFYDNCTISNALSRTINLSVLSKQTHYVNSKDKKYILNICGEKDICNGSTICEGKNGYGSSVNVLFEYPKDSIKLQFTKGTKCSNGSFESDITFVCNSTAGNGSPKLISESSISNCHPHFEWQTDVICKSEMNPSTLTENPVTPGEVKSEDKENEISSNHGVLIVFSLTGITIIVLIIFILRNPSRRARCYRILTNPCSTSSNDRVKYCRVNTTEEARLLLDNSDPTTVCQSDSDDDLLGV